MATRWLSQTGAIFVLLAISKPCIRFRWSLYRFRPKSPHLSSGTLGFPSWGQVQSFLSESCICIAYRIPHIMPCFASCCLCIAPWLIAVPFACVLSLGRAGRRVHDRGTCWERLRGSSFSSSRRSLQARWPYPQNHFYLCLLVARSFAMPMLRYLPLAYHASHIAMSNL